MNTGLETKAMLVILSIGMWSARKHDRKATEHVADAFHTQKSAGNYHKRLLPGDAASYAAIVTAANTARTFHYENTLPWADDGARILPAANFLQYAEGMRKLRAEFESAVETFVQDYPALREQARVVLNGLFRAEDYPRESRIAERFRFGTVILPLPSGEDFRVALSDAEAEAIRQEIDRHASDAVADGMRDAWGRLHDALSKMSDRLTTSRTKKDGSEAEGIFRDSLFDNLRELTDVLPRLNLTGDPELDRMTAEIRNRVLTVTPKEVRTQPATRAATAATVNAIMAQMSGFYTPEKPEVETTAAGPLSAPRFDAPAFREVEALMEQFKDYPEPPAEMQELVRQLEAGDTSALQFKP